MAKPKTLIEPRRYDLIEETTSYLHQRIRNILSRMRARGFDPQVWETYRTQERQWYLYGKGRTAAQLKKAHVDVKYAQPSLAVVTKTLESLHRKRKAADIVSKSRLWNWPEFYVALKQEAKREGMHTLGFEGCHVEWRG
jgi:hypothetical protein